MLNRFIGVVRACADPDFRVFEGGAKLARLRVAIDQRGKGDDKKALFLDAQFWSKQAEVVRDYVSKGQQIALEAELGEESWLDKETQQTKTKFVLRNAAVTLLSRPKEDKKEAPDVDFSQLALDEIPF